VDGNVVDIATIVVGGLSAAVRPLKRMYAKDKPYFSREKGINDMLNGVMLIPFSMMVGSIFSSELMNQLMSSTKITVAIAGMAGLIFVIGEIFKDN
jgi:hypothetical protein